MNLQEEYKIVKELIKRKGDCNIKNLRCIENCPLRTNKNYQNKILSKYCDNDAYSLTKAYEWLRIYYSLSSMIKKLDI